MPLHGSSSFLLLLLLPRPFARRDYVYSGREEGGLFGWDFVAFFGHQVEEIRGGTKEDP